MKWNSIHSPISELLPDMGGRNAAEFTIGLEEKQ